jgi:predicted ArsR family transcriptional regulator
VNTQSLPDPRQMAMEFEPMARRSDPRTSHWAAEQAKELAGRHRTLIVYALAQHGPMGKDGIASKVRGLDGVAVCRRLGELQKAGLIELTGKEVPSTSGRLEREWRSA